MEYAEYDMSKKAEAIEALRLIELRDEFAMRALHTISAYPPEDVATWTADDFARHVYAIADAMLEARK